MGRSRKQADNADRAAMQARLRLAAIVESSEDAIIGADMNGIITDWNNAATRLYGYSADEAIGKPVSFLALPDNAAEAAEAMRNIKRGDVVKHFETVRRRKDGTRIEVSLTVFPIFDTERRVIGASAIVRDITERKRQEASLRESEEWLRMATQAGKMFAYEWNAVTDEIVHSDGDGEILGETKEKHITEQQILNMLPPEDRKKLSAARKRLSPDKPFLQMRHRIVRFDGTMIWVDRSSNAYFDEKGKLLRIVGMLMDVTDRVQAEEAVRQKDRELAEAQRLARVGSWHQDALTEIVTWSEELYRIAGLDAALPAPAYRDLPSLLRPESWERLSRAVEQALRNGTSYELDLEMVRPDGTTRWIKAHGEPVTDSAGRIVALRGTAQDITERKQAEEALADMSRKLLEAQEQERMRISRDLHDDVNQRLAVITVNLGAVARAASAPAEVKEKLRETSKQLTDLGSDVQAIAHRLHSSKLDVLGLGPAAAGFCREVARRHHVEIDFCSENVPEQLPQTISLCLYRILQEALQNAIKHSGSQHFQVSLRGAETEIRLTVHDSGHGFDPQKAMKGQGIGLASIGERLRLVGGQLSIDTKPRGGTTIHARVPLNSGPKRIAAAAQLRAKSG